MNQRIVDGRYDADAAFDTHHGLRQPNKELVFAALREMVSNSVDAGASRIDIILNKANGTFRVLDDGRGFEEEQQDGYFMLYASTKRGKKNQIGQHGTGRTRALEFSSALHVWSVARNFTKGAHTTLDQQMLPELFSKHKLKATWTIGKLPSWWTLSKGKTGSAIDLEIDADAWKKIPDPSVLIRELATLFKPSIGEMVRVNSKRLEIRPMVGDPIRRIFTEKELGRELANVLGGKVEVELFIPEKKDPDERVRLGAELPVYSLDQFLKDMEEPDLAAIIPDLLRRRVVLGDIFIPALNAHVAEDRKSLRVSAFKGFHIKIIQFLTDVLGPVLEDAYAKKEAEEQTKLRNKELEEFAADFNIANGFDTNEAARKLGNKPGNKLTSGKKPEVQEEQDGPIVLNRRRAKLPVHDTLDLKILKVDKGIKLEDIEWILEADPDTVLARGNSYSYTASELGMHTIVAHNRRNNDQRATVKISVSGGHMMAISPGDTDIERGGQQEFRIRNYPMGTKKLLWKVMNEQGLKPMGIRLSNTEGMQVTLTVSENCPLGHYTISVVDKSDADVKAETTFTVKTGLPPNLMRIGDTYYEVKSAIELQGPMIELMQEDVIGTQGTTGTISVNFDHTDFANVSKVTGGSNIGRKLLLRESVIIAHCRAELTAGRLADVNAFCDMVDSLRSSVLQAQAEKK